MHVDWKSAIYSPFVRDLNPGNGSVVGDRVWVHASIDLMEILEALANILVFGPFGSPTGTLPPVFKVRHENTRIWRCYEKQGADDKEAFRRLASFFSRAYNQDLPGYADPAGQEKLEPKRLVASITTIKELLQLYSPPSLDDGQIKDWDYRQAFAKIETRRDWAIEEKKWADKIIESCDLKFLKQWRKTQAQQEEYQKYLAMRNKTPVGP